MLRLFVLLLVLANGLYFAWSQGLLRAYGFAPVVQAEPQRLAQQIRPEALRVLTPAEVQRVQAQLAADQAPKECLMAGPLDDTQATSVRNALGSALPAEAWSLEPVVIPARWMVYMGRFADAEAVEKKRAELRALGVSYDRPGAAWEHGLSLGRFSSEERAQAALKDLARQGIRTARVVQERTESKVYTLRLPAVDRALQSQLPSLRRALAGKRLQPCD